MKTSVLNTSSTSPLEGSEDFQKPNSQGSCCKSETARILEIKKQKQNERLEDFKRLRSLYTLGSDELAILGLKWEELIQKLQTRTLTATQVLNTYIAKALEVQNECNPITDFYPDAHKLAKQLDELEEVKGPLHGIPFCVKDDTNLEGLDTTFGFVRRLYKPAKESAALVKVLQDLGAVPFCKTNVPQTLCTFGSDNPIFGVTTNCLNPKLSPGGSSSGTGALVGGGGALFGTGSDIGGSLRIPAHFNGVSTIKPTTRRVSSKGSESSLPNLVGVVESLGIIGQSPEIVAIVNKYILEDYRQFKYDPLALPIPWDNKLFESTKKLRIGYVSSLPFFPTVGDSADVLAKGREALESLGHTVVPFTLPDGYKVMEAYTKLMLADQCKHFIKCWKNEEVANSVKLVWIGSKLPNWFQKVVSKIMMSNLCPPIHSTRTGVMFGAAATTSTDIWDGCGTISDMRLEILRNWEALDLDLVISNVMPFPAPLVDSPGMLPAAVLYSAIWNMVDFPAGVTTLGTESGNKLSSYDDEGDMALKDAKKAVQECKGCPIGIQIIGKPYQEELILRIMQELAPFNTFDSKLVNVIKKS